MRSFVVIFVLLSLFLCLDARKLEPQEYWNSIMKDQAIPEAIKNLYGGDGNDAKTERFAKDFDMKPNAIIYHSHGGAKAAGQDRTSELKKLSGLIVH